MGGSESSVAMQKVKDFNWLLSAVTDAASVDVIDGFDFTFIQPWSKPEGFLVHSLKLTPRIYPVELAAQSGEPIKPGSYTLSFLADFMDMNLRISQGLDGVGSADLTVPLDEDTKTHLIIQFDLSTIQGYFQTSKQKYNIEAAFTSSHYFSNAGATMDFTFQLTKNITVGALYTLNFFEDQKLLRTGYHHQMGKFESGLIVSYDGKVRLNKSFAYRANERTKGYLQFDMIVSELTAQMAFGIERDFLMTSFGANITSAGSISSKVLRKMGNRRTLVLTSMANLFQRIYKFGVGLSFT